MRLVHLVLLLSVVVATEAVEVTWIGTTGLDTTWATGTNWMGGVAPAAGDSLTFPAIDAAPRRITHNGAVTNIAYGSLTLPSRGYAPANVTGSGFTLTGSITVLSAIGAPFPLGDWPLDITFAPALVHTVTVPAAVTGAQRFTLSGLLASSGVPGSQATVIKAGPGELRLAGTELNQLAGPIRLNDGTLTLDSAAVIAIGGDDSQVFVGDGIGAAATAVLRLEQSFQIHDDSLIDLADDGVFDLNGFEETIGSLTGSAASRVRLGAGSALWIAREGWYTTYDGVIEGASFDGVAISAGTLRLSGANTFTGGSTAVASGRLAINGSVASGAYALDGGTVGGTGLVNGNLFANGGMISPGTMPDDTTSAIGTLAVTGHASMNASSRFSIQVKNPTSATVGFDRLTVGTGAAVAVTLGAAQLDLDVDPAYVSAPGIAMNIVANNGSWAIGGTFAGLPEGATTNRGGRIFAISYVGGAATGMNDVTLTEQIPSGRTTPTLSLASSSNPAATGSSVTFTATIIEGAGSIPGGSVSFFDDGGALGEAVIDPATNRAVLTTASATLTAGANAITAIYAGDAAFWGADAALTQTMAAVGPPAPPASGSGGGGGGGGCGSGGGVAIAAAGLLLALRALGQRRVG